MNNAYEVLQVIRQAIAQETKSGAKIEYSFGQVLDVPSGYVASAYLNGNTSEAEVGFRVPAHLQVSAGDYAFFAVDFAHKSKWIVEVLPNSLFSKIALNVNTGQILTGDGASPPSTIFSGGGNTLIIDTIADPNDILGTRFYNNDIYINNDTGEWWQYQVSLIYGNSWVYNNTFAFGGSGGSTSKTFAFFAGM